jgi:hypothetical protein
MTLGHRRGHARVLRGVLRGGWTPRLVVVEDVPPARLPRGTVEFVPQARESMGRDWFYSMQLEFLGRNLATAGGLEYAYRLGRVTRDIAALHDKRGR